MRRTLEVAEGATRDVSVALERLADWPSRGWWSGDLHVHMNYGGAYRATPAHAAGDGRGRGPARGLRPDRQQGAAHPGRRLVHGPAGPRLDQPHARAPRPGVPHQLLGPHVAARPRAATCCCPTTRATSARPPRASTRRTPRSRTSRAPRARSSATSTPSTTSPTPRARATRRPTRSRASSRATRSGCRSTWRSARSTSTRRWASAITAPRTRSGTACSTAASALPAGAGHRRHDELRLAARPGGPEPRVREDRAGRSTSAASWTGSRPAAASPRTGRSSSSRCGREARAEPWSEPGDELDARRGPPRARGPGLAALDRARRPPRDRPQRRGRRLAAARRASARRPTPAMRLPRLRLGLVPGARLLRPLAPPRARLLPVRHHEPGLRHARAARRFARRPTRATSRLDRPRRAAAEAHTGWNTAAEKAGRARAARPRPARSSRSGPAPEGSGLEPCARGWETPRFKT